MVFVSIEVLGFAAGAVNLFSSVPQLIANLRDPERACAQSPSRNLLQCTGNGLWLVYGLTVGSVAMSTFAALGSLMAAALLLQTFRARQSSNGALLTSGAVAA